MVLTRFCLLVLAVLASGTILAQDQDGTPNGDAYGPGDHTLALKVGKLKRSYIVHVPPKYDANRPMPVVLMLHGRGGNARAAMKQTGWHRKADREGFLAVFPEGIRPDPSRRARFVGNPQTWNDGSGRFYAGKNQIDDVGFTKALIDDLISRFAVDGQRIYVTGFSNGSSMTYRLGVELSDRIAAIAPVASSGLRIEDPKLKRPIPMITIQGSADPRNPLEGGDIRIFGRIDKRPPIRESVESWARLLDCPPTPKTIRDQDGIKGVRYGPGKEGAEVVFYTVEGMGHIWPGAKRVLPKRLVGEPTDKLNGTDLIWEFFKKHAMSVPSREESKRHRQALSRDRESRNLTNKVRLCEERTTI